MERNFEAQVLERLRGRQVTDVDVRVRHFDDETVYLVAVPREDVGVASELLSELEAGINKQVAVPVVITVRAKASLPEAPAGPLNKLSDPRVDALVQLLSSRSRTSESQPSLSYIPNNVSYIAAIRGKRHHLVFGRRGAGKTALLLESKRLVEQAGEVAVWVNAQPYRSEGVERTFLRLVIAIVEALQIRARERGLDATRFVDDLRKTAESADELLRTPAVQSQIVRQFVPDLQRTFRRATSSMDVAVHVFIDDFYFIPRAQQADILDLLHASTRDADIWFKIASIRHLSRWFRPSPPVGLQTGQDAQLIDLDLSLQDTEATSRFLEKLLGEYCGHVGIPNLPGLMSGAARDRLVFASGGVPRDFLTLAGDAIVHARQRPDARSVGVSSVNQAAGDAARTKIGELEDDLSSNAGYADQAIQALNSVRDFCLDEKNYTYFRIDFRDKDRNSDEYAVLTRLLEVRLVHLVDASVSDGQRAGERSECYSLDLSQYSGYRLKQGIRVLDLEAGTLVSRQTRSPVVTPKVVGDTPRKVVQILRGAPQFELSRFRMIVQKFSPLADEIEKLLKKNRTLTFDELALQLGQQFYDVANGLAELTEQGRVEVVDADGRSAFRLARRP